MLCYQLRKYLHRNALEIVEIYGSAVCHLWHELQIWRHSFQNTERLEIFMTSTFSSASSTLCQTGISVWSYLISRYSKNDYVSLTFFRTVRFILIETITKMTKLLLICFWLKLISFWINFQVVAAKIVTNAKTPGSRCYGYVTMLSTEDATTSMQNLHKTELDGRMILVERVSSFTPLIIRNSWLQFSLIFVPFYVFKIWK